MNDLKHMVKPTIRIVGARFPLWVNNSEYNAAVPGEETPQKVSLMTEGKWKVVYFYPKDFTFVCPTEIVDFDNLVPEFEKLNCVVFGVSPDNEFCKLAWKNSHPLLKDIKHTLIADCNNELARECGIISEDDNVPYRVTYIVNPEDDIVHASFNQLSVGRNAAEILRLVDACQKGEQGLLCPANRQVGGETI